MTPIQCANAPATARLFVRLSLRQRCGRPRTNGPPILDVLAPRTAARPCTTRATTKPFENAQSSGWQGRAGVIAHGSRRATAAQPSPQRRGFGTSLPRRGTEAIFNPQHDEDGKEMVLGIAPGAAKRLSEIMARDSNPLLALRIAVESGGCHGFQYLMSLVTLPPDLPSPASTTPTADGSSDGKTIQEDDTIFAYQPDESGEKASLKAPKIILDGPSLELLQGSKVDFTMELIGSQFKIVDNPHATSSCGCGTSFDIKV